jgi:hypothetical protein
VAVEEERRRRVDQHSVRSPVADPRTPVVEPDPPRLTQPGPHA